VPSGDSTEYDQEPSTGLEVVFLEAEQPIRFDTSRARVITRRNFFMVFLRKIMANNAAW
jgi:hypothetical protein